MDREELQDSVKRLLLFVVLIMVYTVIHEYIHHFMALFFGYSTSIEWSILHPYVNLPDLGNVRVVDYVFISLAPHYFNLLLIISLRVFYSIFKKDFLKFLSLLPFINIFWNLLIGIPQYFLNVSNDFGNLLRVLTMHTDYAFFITFQILGIVILSIYFFYPFKDELKRIIKDFLLPFKRLWNINIKKG